jgi:hypothetical protein
MAKKTSSTGKNSKVVPAKNIYTVLGPVIKGSCPSTLFVQARPHIILAHCVKNRATRHRLKSGP